MLQAMGRLNEAKLNVHFDRQDLIHDAQMVRERHMLENSVRKYKRWYNLEEYFFEKFGLHQIFSEAATILAGHYDYVNFGLAVFDEEDPAYQPYEVKLQWGHREFIAECGECGEDDFYIQAYQLRSWLSVDPQSHRYRGLRFSTQGRLIPINDVRTKPKVVAKSVEQGLMNAPLIVLDEEYAERYREVLTELNPQLSQFSTNAR